MEKNIPVKRHCTLNVQHHSKSVPLLFIVDKTQYLAIIELSSNKKFNHIFHEHCLQYKIPEEMF